MRAEHRDGLSRLDDERLVVLETLERIDDRFEGFPAARRATGSAVDDQLVGSFRNLGIEVVHQHAQCRFLRPSFAGPRRAARRADVTTEGAHDELGCRVCATKVAI